MQASLLSGEMMTATITSTTYGPHFQTTPDVGMVAYESKGSEDGQSLDTWQAKFNETEDDDDDVKAAPLVLQVLVETKRHNLQPRFNREDASEYLNQ